MAQPDKTIKKAKVLSITEGSYKDKEGNDVPQWKLVLQDEENPARVLTGTCKPKEGLAQNAVVEDVWVYENDRGGSIYTSFFFPKPKGSGGGGGGKYEAPKEDPVLKIVGLAFSYTKDIIMQTSTGEFNWEDFYTHASATAGAMLQSYNVLKK